MAFDRFELIFIVTFYLINHCWWFVQTTKPLIGLGRHLVDKLNRPGWYLIALYCTPVTPGHWFVGQFPCIYGQISDRIEFKLDGSTYYIYPSLISFWYSPLNPGCSFSLIVRAFSVHLQTKHIEFGHKFGGWNHYGTRQAWLTLNALTFSKFHLILILSWWSLFRVFTKKVLMALISNLMGDLIMGLPNSLMGLPGMVDIW